MNNNFNNWLDQFYGNWITKKSIYLLKNKIQNNYEEALNIFKDTNTTNIYSYQLNFNVLKNNNKNIYYQLICLNNNIQKNNSKLKQSYNINKINNKLLKIDLTTKSKNIIYSEYIYSINNNFKISIGLLKKNNKYLLTIFTSYIKTNNL